MVSNSPTPILALPAGKNTARGQVHIPIPNSSDIEGCCTWAPAPLIVRPYRSSAGAATSSANNSVCTVGSAGARSNAARAAVPDLHLHDLRHEGITRIAESAHMAGIPITPIELAAISGHRDLRTLARYAHICASNLAQRLDQAFERAAESEAGLRKGRKRLGGRDGLKLNDVHVATARSVPGSSNVISFPDLPGRRTR